MQMLTSTALCRPVNFSLMPTTLQAPNVTGNARFHCWRHSQAFVYPTEIVIREMQGASGFVIVGFLENALIWSGIEKVPDDNARSAKIPLLGLLP